MISMKKAVLFSGASCDCNRLISHWIFLVLINHFKKCFSTLFYRESSNVIYRPNLHRNTHIHFYLSVFHTFFWGYHHSLSSFLPQRTCILDPLLCLIVSSVNAFQLVNMLLRLGCPDLQMRSQWRWADQYDNFLVILTDILVGTSKSGNGLLNHIGWLQMWCWFPVKSQTN